MQTIQVDFKQLVLFNGTFGPQEIRDLEDGIAGGILPFNEFREAVNELDMKEDLSPASMVRLGVCLYLLGKYSRAVEAFKSSDGGALSLFYLGKCAFAEGDYTTAIEKSADAAKAGYNGDECALRQAEALRYSNKTEGSLAKLDGLSGAVEQTAEYLYQRGATVAAVGGNPLEVARLYERAIDVDAEHSGALFGLALENDRYGNDDEARDCYRKSAKRFPPHVGSLMNLGILYEDRNEFQLAAQCYQRIIDQDGTNEQARMYLRDTEASSGMFFDEDAKKSRDRLSQVLSVPVTDFELSVRSRNCLQKMDIATLGDLCACTEQELLASKNFGETSLVEINEMLTAKGLRLGQLATEKQMAEPYDSESLSADEQALLARPVADLGLSVRARKCMIRLGITTIGELLRRSGDDLLECKNFGVTSLNEVREKLEPHTIKLRGD